MSHMPTPRRLWNALMPQPGMPAHLIEPVLSLDSLPSGLDDAPAPPRLVRRAIEQALEEGSRRVYEPMQEAELVERRA